ncbi:MULTISPECIES: cobyric acid synthase [unclassified Veillonella]|uniref:cobyric acid synthase n=1 Tax=unclassified Veillonella TaxID=2630086 RepID=UPI000F8D210F|nr:MULTISPECIES: cobyric acid synthase [unclassified Veillonella]
MAKKIMFQGTSSNVGKSILATAMCRILHNKGYKTVPFKAQNMALNSYVTKAGDEIGRAQVAQAEAAGLEPIVQMNPVLLKPTGNQSSQVVLMGKPVGVYSAREYHTKYSLTALDKVKESLQYLDDHFDMIVIEGAGSPAEVNLKANDIVNMRVAKLAKAPVMLIADIDRGGAIASVVGTLELLEPDERDLVKGIIINKFRGDVTLLQPALDFIEEKTGKKVVGVVPAIENLDIDEEDSVALESKYRGVSKEITIAVMQTPKISNFTDFDALAYEPDVSVRFVKQGEPIGQPDMVILPGSKNTLADLAYLQEHGYDKDIHALAEAGVPVLGICGGNQMLGEMLYDPEGIEGDIPELKGLGLLPTATTMKTEKLTHQVCFDVKNLSFLGTNYSGENLVGYEIHMGDTQPVGPGERCFHIQKRSDAKVDVIDGFVTSNGQVMGTYIHGILDNDGLRRSILNALRTKKGLEPLDIVFRYFEHKEAAYNRLAKIVEEHLDMDYIQSLWEQE